MSKFQIGRTYARILTLIVICTISVADSLHGQTTILSHESGFYTSNFFVTITPAVPGAQVRYTINGSAPTTSSTLYASALLMTNRSSQPNGISLIPTNDLDPNDMAYREGWKPPQGLVAKANIIRARSFFAGEPVGDVVSATYFVFPEGQDRYSMPIFSIMGNPDDFFSDETGIYVKGNNNNYFQSGVSWERPVFIQMWEDDGTLAISQNGGVRLHGNTTRTRARKSLRLYAKSEYGESWFNHRLFPDKPVQRYKRFILRNGGNDWSEAIFRDDFMTSLIRGSNTEVQYSRPAIVFLNGEYWGVHMIRDRFDERHIETHYGIEEDEMTMIDNNAVFDEGVESGVAHYQALIDYIKTRSMAVPANWQHVQQQMDVNSFIDHFVSNVYFGNTDWPGNNQKMWRKNVAYSPNAPVGHDGRWRWMTYDTDFGFGLNFHYVPGVNEGPVFNSMSLISTISNNWPNYTWSTEIFRALSINTEFKRMFVNRMQDLLNTSFKSDHVVLRIADIKNQFDPEMNEHIARWGWPLTKTAWTNEVQRMVNYGQTRTEIVRNHVRLHFMMEQPAILRVNNRDVDNGVVRVNSIRIEPDTEGIPASFNNWEGLYFRNYPVEIEAIAKPGYRFEAWDGPVANSSSAITTVTLTTFTTIRAIFVVEENPYDTMNPEPFVLAESNDGYMFTEWSSEEAEYVFPPHMVFQQTRMTDPGLSDDMTDPYHVPESDIAPDDAAFLGFPYKLTTRTRMNGLDERGISFINTGRGRDLGAALLALDTRGVSEATISFTAGTERPNSRIYALRLQYRLGLTGSWVDVEDDGNHVEYVRSASEGHEQDFVVDMPLAAMNQPYVQLRWKYYFMGSPTSGARAMLRLDDIVVKKKVSNSLESDVELPSSIELLPNYPNPFNPSTTIAYRLNVAGNIKLTVFNSLGQLVSTVVDENQTAGHYTVPFNGSKLSSGVFFIRLESSGQVQTGKMVLIK
jgi:hypothetical protein